MTTFSQQIIMYKINRVLIVADASNFEYVVVHSAVSKWYKDHKDDDALCLKSPLETDQENLPNILTIDSFKRVLHKETQSRLESINWIAKSNHQLDLDCADGIDIIFTEDSKLSGNFRKKLYPQYKAHRSLVLHNFNIPVVKEYIQDVIFKELDIENKFGYKIIKVENCESDDIIAVLMDYYKNYACRILISNDKDFLQLEGVNQYDMWGKKVQFKLKNHDDFTLQPMEFLYWKIIRGDLSDNIKNVFPKFGDVKSYNLVKDRQKLKQMLTESQEAAERFMMNKKLIDFREIPTEIREKILTVIKEKMDQKSDKEQAEEFSASKCMII